MHNCTRTRGSLDSDTKDIKKYIVMRTYLCQSIIFKILCVYCFIPITYQSISKTDYSNANSSSGQKPILSGSKYNKRYL